MRLCRARAPRPHARSPYSKPRQVLQPLHEPQRPAQARRSCSRREPRAGMRTDPVHQRREPGVKQKENGAALAPAVHAEETRAALNAMVLRTAHARLSNSSFQVSSIRPRTTRNSQRNTANEDRGHRQATPSASTPVDTDKAILVARVSFSTYFQRSADRSM